MIYKIINDKADDKMEERKIINQLINRTYEPDLKKELEKSKNNEVEIARYKICLDKAGKVIIEGRLVYNNKGFVHLYKVKGGLELFNLLGR